MRARGNEEDPWPVRSCPATACCSRQGPAWPEDRKARDQSTEEENGCQTAQSRGAEELRVGRPQPRPALADKGRQSNRQKNAQDNVQGFVIVAFEAVTDLEFVHTQCAGGCWGIGVSRCRHALGGRLLYGFDCQQIGVVRDSLGSASAVFTPVWTAMAEGQWKMGQVGTLGCC